MKNMKNLQEKIHFADMHDLFRRVLGLTELSPVDDHIDIEPTVQIGSMKEWRYGRTLAENMATRTVHELAKLPSSKNESKVSLGAGAVVVCEGTVYSVLKGSPHAAEDFLHAISGKICSLHLCVAASSRAKRIESVPYNTKIGLSLIDISAVEEIHRNPRTDGIDFLDVLFRRGSGSTQESRLQWEEILRQKFGMFLMRNIALVSG
ncbi:MAG: hypothetical protein WCL23_01700 [Candidatus Moraniibacteriota bacterium]